MNNDENLDLLDLDDGTSMDTLPDATPFNTPRSRRPWLLVGIAVVVIILATYIIIRTIGSNSSSSMDVDLDTPAVVVDGGDDVAANPDLIPGTPTDVPVVPVAGDNVAPRPAPAPAVAPVVPAPVAAPAPAPRPAPVAKPAAAASGSSVRVIEDRKEVTFNPSRAETKPTPKASETKPAPKATSNTASTKANYYVQFGSYSTRGAAESAQKKIQGAHSGLFAGKQLVVLAAQLPNGTTTYRLRVGFKTSADANSFCRNAKSDGLDCYVAK